MVINFRRLGIDLENSFANTGTGTKTANETGNTNLGSLTS